MGRGGNCYIYSRNWKINSISVDTRFHPIKNYNVNVAKELFTYTIYLYEDVINDIEIAR